MTKLAGCILCFDRPHYLEQLLDSIENSLGANRADWFAFVDGAFNKKSGRIATKQKKIDQNIAVLKNSNIGFKNIQINEWNQGIAIQKDRAHSLFDDYETVMFFEDDLVIGRYYIKLLRLAIRDYPNDMILMNRHPEPKKASREYLNECGIARAWGYILNRHVYAKFRDRWKEYISYIGKVDYKKRLSVDREKRKKFPYGSFSHDVVLTNLLRESGSRKLWPEISRGQYIGKKGSYAYALPHFWKKRKMHKQREKINFKEDFNLKRFKLR